MINSDFSLDWSGFKSYLVRIEVLIDRDCSHDKSEQVIMIVPDLSLDWSGLKSW
jgi:hypothetical protein